MPASHDPTPRYRFGPLEHHGVIWQWRASPAGVLPGIGVIRDRQAGTYAGVLRVRGSTFALRDDADQHHLVGGWADVLASQADSDSPVSRLQVVERTLPDTGEDAARYLREEMRRPPGDDLVRSYLELLDEAAPVSREHE